jgi:lipid-A-disaccharide synthase
MRAAGCRLEVEAKDIAVVGLAEVVTHLPKIWSRFRKLLRAVDAARPDAAVLIDFPDWNLRLARELHRRHIPVIYYVSPQLWAWRPNRIEQIRRYVRKMLVIFPFEEAWYRERGVAAEYVGHPLADQEPPQNVPPLRSPQTPIAILPGSRAKEIALNLPTMLQASRALGKEYQFVIPVASTVSAKWMVDLIHRSVGQDPGINLKLESDARMVLAQARAAMVASGTATVEAALIGTPFVMVYRVSPLTWKLGRRLVNVPFFAMPNLIAGREVVPELVQENFTPDSVVERMNQIIPDGPGRQSMRDGLREVREKLAAPAGAASASDRAAEAVLMGIANCLARQLVGEK